MLTFLIVGPHANAFVRESEPDVSALRGSLWRGNFRAVGPAGKIEICFLPDLTIQGGLQYTHNLEGCGELGTVLGPFDKACDFTARTLMLSSPVQTAGQAGKIYVYKCSKSFEEEQELVANGRGSPFKKIKIERKN